MVITYQNYHTFSDLGACRAANLGKDKFYSYIRKFGFGSKQGSTSR